MKTRKEYLTSELEYQLDVINNSTNQMDELQRKINRSRYNVECIKQSIKEIEAEQCKKRYS